MDCKYIEDRLLDYIDNELNIEEEKSIREHLNNCENCYRKYREIKSTVDYIKGNSDKINTNKELNLNPNKNRKNQIGKFSRTGVFAIALSIILVVTGFATDIFDFMKWWRKSSERDIFAWEELIENGVGQKLDISATDKDIKVTAEGVIADELNTIILLSIEDLKGNIRFSPFIPSELGGSYPEPLMVRGDIPRHHEDVPPLVNYRSLYTEAENTVKLMVETEPMDKDEGKVEIYLNKLASMLNKDKDSIVEVSGNWDMTIPVRKVNSRVYNIDKTIDLDGNELIIEKITVAPTATSIQYSIETYNKEKRYFIDDITFLIQDGNKTYSRSELSYGDQQQTEKFGYSRGEFHSQSLFLEEPKKIDIVVNTYRYTTRGREKYAIDWNNLPQIIEYDNSKITVEDIKYNEDSTEVFIKEDDSDDREYIKSNIYFRIDEVIKKEYDGIEYSHRRDYHFQGSYPEYETRDAKGRVGDIEDKFWTDEFHNFVFTQKLTLSIEDFRRYEMDEDNYERYLIPNELYIEGQKYIKYPNKKITINLGR